MHLREENQCFGVCVCYSNNFFKSWFFLRKSRDLTHSQEAKEQQVCSCQFKVGGVPRGKNALCLISNNVCYLFAKFKHLLNHIKTVAIKHHESITEQWHVRDSCSFNCEPLTPQHVHQMYWSILALRSRLKFAILSKKEKCSLE